MVELAAAVVRDVDHVDAVLDRELGVLGGGDALDDQRNPVLVLDQLDGVPIERHLEVAAETRCEPVMQRLAMSRSRRL